MQWAFPTVQLLALFCITTMIGAVVKASFKLEIPVSAQMCATTFSELFL